jgi:N-acetylmuramoyl-L-alanine amidase
MADTGLLTALSPNEIVGLTLIGEARGEPIEDIVAVGNVIKNRLYRMGTPYKSYNDVCLADEQFSCWNSNDTNRPFLIDLAAKMIHNEAILDPYLVQCLFIAEGIVANKLMDNTKSAQYYMASTLLNSIKIPVWAKNRKNDIVKGNHTFFSLL